MSVAKGTIAFALALALATSMTACGNANRKNDDAGSVANVGNVEDANGAEDAENGSDGTESGNDDASANDEKGTTEGSDENIVDGVLVKPIKNGYEKGIHHARFDVEGYGTITVELDADSAPITVSNFADLVNSKFYDGLTFHRIMKGFMIQGGDPRGDGTGGSDRLIKGEFAENGVRNDISHTRGTISMARALYSDTGSSQFFICDSDEHKEDLDGAYAAFGHVTEGMDVVDRIADVSEKALDDNGTIASEDQPVIKSVTMID